jgi:prevent-host-death family protein
MAQPRSAGRGEPGGSRPISRYAGWKLEDAKSRFSELVRRARDEGPQRVTVRGADAVVVIAAEEFDRLLPKSAEPVSFVAFMESLSVDGLDLTREPDLGRDPAL